MNKRIHKKLNRKYGMWLQKKSPQNQKDWRARTLWKAAVKITDYAGELGVANGFLFIEDVFKGDV